MQRNIDITDRYRVKFYKPIWSENEEELAACFSIVRTGNYYICDIRTTNNKALFEFLKTCFPYIMLSNSSARFKAELFKRLKTMYADLYQEFLNNHYPNLNYPKELYGFQKEVLSEIMYNKNKLLAMDMGTGKSIVSASVSKLLKINRTIIVGPTLIKWNWIQDMTEKWNFDPLLWTILDRNKSKCLHAFLTERFVVVNYEMIDKFWGHLTKSNVDHIIFDEVHKAKNTKTDTFKRCHKLVKHFPNARVTLLTGTPFTNRIIDMFAYLKLTGHPLGKSITKFKKQYAISSGMRGNKVTGAKNIDDLRSKLSNFMIRLKAEDCLDLPDLIIKNFYFDVGELSGEYSEKMDELVQMKAEYDVLQGKEKAQKGVQIRGNIHTLNRLASESKVGPVIKLIDSLTEQGKKVIVFSGYTNPLTMLQEHYKDKSVLINGSVEPHKRQTLIDRYKSDPNCNVFLGNFKAAGVGINLVNSNHVIFMNFPFTPDDLEQPYKRAHRIGQTEKVYVYYTLGRGTIDERVYEIIKDKAEDINSLIDDNKNVVNYGSLESKLFKSLIAEYQKKKGVVTNDAKTTGFVSVK